MPCDPCMSFNEYCPSKHFQVTLDKIGFYKCGNQTLYIFQIGMKHMLIFILYFRILLIFILYLRNIVNIHIIF